MDDEEDVKKMIEFIKLNQEEGTQDFQYDDFITCENENSDVEENEEEICFDNNYDFCSFTNSDISRLNSYDPRSTLKPEERAVIDTCLDPELKNILLLNRTKNLQLMQLYKKLKDLLIQCQKDINEKTEVIHNFMNANKYQFHSTGAWRLGAPYFKDKKLYACPPNADTLRKKRNRELCIYDLTVPLKWSSLECEKLLRAVKLNFNSNQQRDVLKKINNLEQSENKDGLIELQNRMMQLKDDTNSEIPPLNSDQHIDWMRVAEVFFQDRRSFVECKSFWHIYLHPDINKSPWTPEENTKLKSLVKKYKFQNWDAVAAALDNKRTGFTTCMNYCSNLYDRFKKGDFTREEDSMLLRLIHKHKMGSYIPWVKIAQHFKNRTRSQLHYRYTYYLKETDRKKGKFTDAEDILLMILVDRFGKNFKKCAEYFPARSPAQIKARYNSNLQQKLKKGSFSIEEDEIILKFVKEHGEKSYTKLTKLLQRCRGQIRQRYATINAYLQKNPNATLAKVPRRKHNLKEEEEAFSFLRMVADHFLDSPNIPTEQDIENVLNGHHREEENIETIDIPNFTNKRDIFDVPFSIDDMLTNFFCNSFKINSSKCISSKYVIRAARNVQEVLDVLGATLDIPLNFDEDLRLDNLDVAILNTLVDGTIDQNKAKKNTCELIPPNLNSLVGLRSLLIKYYNEKSEQKKKKPGTDPETKNLFYNAVRSDIVKHLLNLPENIRKQVQNDRKLFFTRFQAIFKWPAIMTFQHPSSELQDTSNYKCKPTTIKVKRTYSKKDRHKVEDCPEKRMKIADVPSSSSEIAPLKLTPVTNRSVIADLMRNKNKKLFCMETVKSGSETKMLIKEINFRSNASEKFKDNVPSMKKSDSKCKSKIGIINNIVVKPFSEPKSSKCDKVGDLPSVPCEKKEDLPLFIPAQGKFIVSDMEEDSNLNKVDESFDKGADDVRDLNRLEAFLKEQRTDDEDDDLDDLKKLEIFLKCHEESETDCTDSIPNT